MPKNRDNPNFVHKKRPLLKVIRSFCIDCMGGQIREVRRCTSTRCDLYPYRMGKNPFYASKVLKVGTLQEAGRDP